MRFPRYGWVVIALLVATGSHDAAARGRAPGVPSYPVTKMSHTIPNGVDGTLPVCQLGVTGGFGSSEPVLDFDPVDGDYFYTWLNLDSLNCTQCGLGTYGQLTAAHVALFFPTAPETAVVGISVVGIVQTTCRFQDPNIVYCAGFDYLINWQDAQLANDFAIPFPEECKLEITALGSGQAFLETNFKYSSLMAPADRPQIVTQASVIRCQTYNPITFPQEDWVDTFGVGNPIIYADVQKCFHVPTLRKSWGQLKQIYR